MYNNNLENAILFGRSLDQDDFKVTATLLSQDCRYKIGEKELKGPMDIVSSYEQNMIDGRKKLDKLEWGKSRVEPINDSEYFIHFTDYLTHNEESFTHRCKQKVIFNKKGKIIKIEHVDDQKEQNRLNEYYQRVGLK